MRCVDVADAVRARRARRVLSETPVDDEAVRSLVEAARLSASCFNNQPWRLIFCRGPGPLSSLRSALSKGNAWATKATLLIAVAAKQEDDCRLSDGRDYYLFDCGLAIGQLVLRATELGLVAHPIAGYDPVRVKQALGIPEGYTVITLVVCGYPGSDDSLLSDKQKEAESSRPERKPLAENFQVDAWGNGMS